MKHWRRILNEFLDTCPCNKIQIARREELLSILSKVFNKEENANTTPQNILQTIRKIK
jgi:hypothetical protein